jgi:hypothetical protein
VWRQKARRPVNIINAAPHANIGSRIDEAALDLFGRHMRHRPHHHAGPSHRAVIGRDTSVGCRELGQPEVGASPDFSSMVLPGFRSRWTMPAVRGVQRGHDFHGGLQGGRTAAAHASREASVSPSMLHHQEVEVLDPPNVVRVQMCG